MHAVIAGISDDAYVKLIALCTGNLDHSWVATHLLEQAIAEAPTPGRCKICGGPFWKDNHKKGRPIVYCSDPCRAKGYQDRKMRWWRKKGQLWRTKQRGKAARGSPRGT